MNARQSAAVNGSAFSDLAGFPRRPSAVRATSWPASTAGHHGIQQAPTHFEFDGAFADTVRARHLYRRRLDGDLRVRRSRTLLGIRGSVLQPSWPSTDAVLTIAPMPCESGGVCIWFPRKTPRVFDGEVRSHSSTVSRGPVMEASPAFFRDV